MIKTIYHGSDHVIQHPVFHGGKRNNDYGYGFYCTESKEMAMEWAVRPDVLSQGRAVCNGNTRQGDERG